MLTHKEQAKYNELLSKIINKDESLLERQGEYFNDSDFEQDDDVSEKKG